MSTMPQLSDTTLDDELYVRFRDLLHGRCGLAYPEHKRADLNHGLRMALNISGHTSLRALYAAALHAGPAWDAIVTQLTIGETYFFRNGAQFEALRQQILPDLLARRARIRTLRMWSAGCATGEEPYSLAMLISDVLQGSDSWHVTILATDINPVFLARAREGLYGAWSFREMPAAQRDRFFNPEGQRWRLDSAIRRMVGFAQLNLAEASYPSITTGTCALDLIVCRNVTIYFDTETTARVANRFFEALAPGGWLIVGHAEPQANIYHQFETHNFPNAIMYRKPLSAPGFGTQVPALPSLLTPPVDRQPKPMVRPLARAVPHSTPARPRNGEFEQSRPAAEPTLTTLIEQGQHHADSGDWATAEAYVQAALQRDPLFIPAHYLQGQIYEHQGQLDAALGAYRRSVFLDRAFVLGVVAMGHIYQQLGHPADARRCYRNALRQLQLLPAATAIRGAPGATAGMLAELVSTYLQLSS